MGIDYHLQKVTPLTSIDPFLQLPQRLPKAALVRKASSSSSAMTETHLPSPPSSDSSLSSLSGSPSPKEEESNEFYNQLASQLDPFTYLLQPDAMATDDLTLSSSMNDWPSFPSLADSVHPPQSKVDTIDFGGEFNFAMPMDLSLESTFIDPSALHFNTSIFSQPDHPFQGLSSTQPELAPSSSTQLLGQNGPPPDRRLSVTSSSSSSGASLSPILECQPTPEATKTIPANSHEELAQKVLQAIGVALSGPSNTSNPVTSMFIRSSSVTC